MVLRSSAHSALSQRVTNLAVRTEIVAVPSCRRAVVPAAAAAVDIEGRVTVNAADASYRGRNEEWNSSGMGDASVTVAIGPRAS